MGYEFFKYLKRQKLFKTEWMLHLGKWGSKEKANA